MTNETANLIETRLRALDIAVDTAISDEDDETLGRILGDDFVYTHSIERSDGLADFLAWVHKPRESRSRRELSNIKVEVHGDVAVTRGHLDIIYADQSRKYLRYVRVYRRRTADEWRLISSRTVPADDRTGSV